jgi:hypothetical protein
VTRIDSRGYRAGGPSPLSGLAKPDDPPAPAAAMPPDWPSAPADPTSPVWAATPHAAMPPDWPATPAHPTLPDWPSAPAYLIPPDALPPPVRLLHDDHYPRHRARRGRLRRATGSRRRIAGALEPPPTAMPADGAKLHDRDHSPTDQSRYLERVNRSIAPLAGLLIIAAIVVGAIDLVDGHAPKSHLVRSPSHVSATMTRTATPRAIPTIPKGYGASSFAGVTLPNTGGGRLPLHPLRLLLVVDNQADLARVDLATLGSWIGSHERRGSLVRILVGGGLHRELSAPLSASEFAAMQLTLVRTGRQAQKWLRARVRARARAEHPTRLVVDVGYRPHAPRIRGASIGAIRLVVGAHVPSATTADPRRHDGIAAALALQIIGATGQSEIDAPHLR